MLGIVQITRQVIKEFGRQFMRTPYLSYTEQGQHAQFFSMLLDAFPPEHRYFDFSGQRICTIQNEYPTATTLGKPQRQHWDVAIVKTPPEPVMGKNPPYDYFKLVLAVEFGLNEAQEHLQDDLERLSHPGANIDCGFVVHFYRLSAPGALFSNRDWSSHSKRILRPEQVAGMVKDSSRCREIEILYGMCDPTGQHKSGLWWIDQNGISAI